MMLNTVSLTPRISSARNRSTGGPPVTILNDENSMSSMYNRKKSMNSSNIDKSSFSCSKSNKKKYPIFPSSSKKKFGKDFGNCSITPGPSSSRRVLGDISNRKATRPLPTHNDGTIKMNRNKSVTFRETIFRDVETPGTNGNRLKTGSVKKNTKKGVPLKNNVTESLLKNTKMTPKSHNGNNCTPKEYVRQVEIPVLPCDDVELPAGRMWHEQSDDEDEYNCSFELNISADSLRVTLRREELKNRASAQDYLEEKFEELAHYDSKALDQMSEVDSFNVFDENINDNLLSWGQTEFDDDISL